MIMIVKFKYSTYTYLPSIAAAELPSFALVTLECSGTLTPKA